MKKLIALTLLLLAAVLPTHAQWVVYDPSVHTQTILNGVQEVAKFVEVINNQVQQIRALTDQLNEFKHYESLFGDPKAIALNTVAVASAELRRAEAGLNLNLLIERSDGAAAVTYDGAGLYVNVGARFETVNGEVPRAANSYRPYAAINQATANYLAVSTNAAVRRVVLKAEIEQNIRALQNAKTDAEVQKLSAGLTSLLATLDSVDHEVNQALASAIVQDIENRNDERKQAQAVGEQRQEAFREAVSNYSQKFPLLTEPARFPTTR